VGEGERVTELLKGTQRHHGFAVSPDGRWVLYAQVDKYESDIMLVEYFR
jgi:hypothetical protein